MSNYGNDIVELGVTNDEMKEMLHGEPPCAPCPACKSKKHVMSRLWALVLAIAPIALLCFLPTLLLVKTTVGYAIEAEKTLLDAFLALFNELLGKDGLAKFYEGIANAPASFESFKLGLPLLAGNGFFGKVYSFALYAIPASMLLNLILMFVALFSGKKAPKLARAIAFINLFVYGSYALGVIGLAKYGYLKVELLSLPVYVLAGIAGLSLLVYLVYSFAKTKKVGVPNFFLLLLSAVWVACFVYAYIFVNYKTGENVRLALVMISGEKSLIPALTNADFFKYLVWGVGGLSVLNLFVSAVRMSTKKGFLFDVLRHILHLLVAGVCVFLAFTTDLVKELPFMDLKLFLIVAAGVALLQIILAATTRARLKKQAKAQASLEPVAEVESVEEDGEEMEAVRYDYAAELVDEAPVVEEVAEEEPVEEGEEVAEEEPVEEPTPAPAPAEVPGYDFYNSKSFDPFIASLGDEERKQFTEIFILKYHGETKNLPDYVVGGDNTEFFRKVFIYLGQYREKIPSKLLAKMYTFSSRK